MTQFEQLCLAIAFTKAAATAPSSLGDTGKSMMPGMSSTPPMASMMNQMSSAMSKNPVEAVSMNPGGAPGGMLSRWASQAGKPLASMLNTWQQQQNSFKGRAFY